MDRFFRAVVLIGLTGLLFSGIGACSSDELTRKSAAKILEKYNGDGNEAIDLASGYVVAGWMPSPDGFLSGTKQITPDTYRAMEKAGLVYLQSLGRVTGGEKFLVEFPESVKNRYVLGTEIKEKVVVDGKTYAKETSRVLLAKRSIKQITGIRQEQTKAGSIARIEFVFHFEVSPFGQLLLDGLFKGDVPYIAKLAVYDDGWRIAGENIYPAVMANALGL